MKKRFLAIVCVTLLLCAMLVPVAAGAEGKTLTLVSWYTEDALKPVLDLYAEKTGNQIEVIYSPPVHDYIQTLQVLLTSGEYPDLFYVAAENKRDIGRGEFAVDLSDMPVWDGISDIYKLTWEYDGKTLAYAPDAWVAGIFYNIDLFEQFDLEAPTNWDEFINCCKVFEENGIYGYLSPKSGVHDIPQMLFINTTIAKDLNFEDKINSGEATYTDGWHEALELWYNDFVSTGLLSPACLGLDNTAVEDMFLTGQAAMVSGGPWAINGYREKNPDMNLGMAAGFGPDGDKMSTGAVNVGIAVCSQGDNIEDAMEFLEFFADPDTIVEYQKVTGNVLGVEGIEYTIDELMAPRMKIAENGDFYLPQIFWKHSESIYLALLEGCQNIIAEIGTVDDVCTAMDQYFAELESLE